MRIFALGGEYWRRCRKDVLTAAVAGALLFATALVFRAEIASDIWYRFHVFPRLSLALTGDALLAASAGDHYFNAFGEGVYDLGKAERYFKKALEIDPDAPLAWFQLARIDFLHSRFSSALEKINKQMELHGDGPYGKAYYIRGLIYGYRDYPGDSEKAEADFLAFIERNPKSWAAHNDLAWVYFRRGDFAKAEEWARRGIEAGNHGNPWLLTMRGVSLLNLGRKAEARGLLEEALAAAERLTEADWSRAYPGNDPKAAEQGLREIKETVRFNLGLAVDN